MLKKQTTKSIAVFTTEKKVLISMVFLFLSSFLFAHEKIVVKGKIFTENNIPLAGVSVNVKETSGGTTTDADGNFSIQVSKGATIVLSFVGYEEKTVKVSNEKSAANIQMVSTTSSLGEVVVVGYGKQKKVNLTGSFSTLNNKDLKTIPSSNMVTGLAGKLPGLRVTQQTGEPGSYNSLFDIRGFGTPLIVVDGLVTEEGTFVRLNPDEIDQITVIKDASAAIYGVKAANGVILVTTRKGETGKAKITYTGTFGIQKLNKVLPVGDAYTFALLTTENEINQGKSPAGTTYTPDDLQKYKDGTFPSTDWRGLVANNQTFKMGHNITISGGSDKMKYFASMGYLKELGLWKSGDLNYKKYNVRINVTSKITDNLESEINLSGVLDPKNEPMMGVGNALFSTGLQNPATPFYANNNPQYLFAAVSGEHPLGLTNAAIGGYTRTTNQNIQGSFQLNYRVPFVKGLTAKFMFGLNKQENFYRQWRKQFLMYTYDKVTDTYTNSLTTNAPSNLFEDYYTFLRTTLLGQINYQKTFFGKHNVKASLIYEERHDKNDNFNAYKEMAINVDQFYAGLSTNQTVNSGGISENRNQNIIGRVDYDFSSKYLFEFGFNNSGSSRFPKGKQWGFFPYTSAGWRISEESFFKKALPIVTNLKLRASIGTMGDDAASSFQFVSGYNYPSRNYVFNSQVIPGLGFRAMPNPNITWYTVTSKNFGIDLSLKNGLIYGQFDLFQRNRSGLLGTRLLSVPGTVGAALSQENLNKDMRRGFELVLGHTNTIGGFRYDISANVTYTRGQPTYSERAKDANSYLNWRNNSTNRWDNISWGYEYIGQFQTEAEILNSPLQDDRGNASILPGDLKYADINKDGIINDLDVVPIGRTTVRDMNFGLNFRGSYKQFDISFLFQGAAFANYSYTGTLQEPLLLGRNTLKVFLDRWHHEDIYDVNSPWVPGRFPSINTNSASNNLPSKFWNPDASYLRLKQVEIGYSLKKSWAAKAGIENLRVYASGFNLLTWTKVQFVDPELSNDNWNSEYPITGIYNFGISLTF